MFDYGDIVRITKLDSNTSSIGMVVDYQRYIVEPDIIIYRVRRKGHIEEIHINTKYNDIEKIRGKDLQKETI